MMFELDVRISTRWRGIKLYVCLQPGARTWKAHAKRRKEEDWLTTYEIGWRGYWATMKVMKPL